MTLFNIVQKNLKQNMRHYGLYFFALIFSVAIYFIFLTLQYDEQVKAIAGEQLKVDTMFKAAAILLIIFVSLFVFYANNFFLNTRKKEMGIYSLVGIEKRTIGRMLLVENIILGIGSLLVGVLVGTLFSRLFILVLFQLMKVEATVTLSFSPQALMQTMVVFAMLILIVSLQGYLVIYRYTLIELFKAESEGEEAKSIPSWLYVVLGLVGIGLMLSAYFISGDMFAGNFLFNVVFVLGGVIIGTYLFFKMSIDFFLRIYRRIAKRYYRYVNMLSISTILYRMKSNAMLLTMISILSAMTIVLVGFSYSLYYSANEDTRAEYPADFTTNQADAQSFADELSIASIEFEMTEIKTLKTKADLSDFDFLSSGYLRDEDQVSFVKRSSVEDLLPSKAKVGTIIFDPQSESSIFPKPEGKVIKVAGEEITKVNQVYPFHIVNVDVAGYQVVIDDDLFDRLAEAHETTIFASFMIKDEVEEARNLYGQVKQQYIVFHDELAKGLIGRAILIFIGGFLGIVFLLALGSIIYFKQISEIAQDQKRYKILHHLGFSVQEIMRAIRRQQLFVFGFPLLLGVSHSIFALRSLATVLGIGLLIPIATAVFIYVVIYGLYYYFTIAYYHRVIRTIHLI